MKGNRARCVKWVGNGGHGEGGRIGEGLLTLKTFRNATRKPSVEGS